MNHFVLQNLGPKLKPKTNIFDSYSQKEITPKLLVLLLSKIYQSKPHIYQKVYKISEGIIFKKWCKTFEFCFLINNYFIK